MPKKKLHDTYAVRQAKQKKAQALKKVMVDDVIRRIDQLEAFARKADSLFTQDEREEIDQARFDLQSIRSGWANKTRRR